MTAVPIGRRRREIGQRTLPKGWGVVPGWALMAGVALTSWSIANVMGRVTGGTSLVEPVTLAILAGLVLRNVGAVPIACDRGVHGYEAVLKLGIVLMGLSLTLSQAVNLGAHALVVVVACLVAAPILIYVLGKRFHLTTRLGVLIGVGTTICGSTAIAIAAPIIEARDEETSYAIGTISLFGVLGMLLLPMIGAALGTSNAEFAMWAGTAVPATPQVIGAASIYGDGAIAQATVVKMTRNVFMIPALFVVGIWYARQRLSVAGRRPTSADYRKAVPAFLFGFVLFALIRSLVDHFALVSRPVWTGLLDGVAGLDRALILVAMAGIGLNTKFGAIRKVGVAPLVVGLLGSLFVSVISFIVIRGLGLGR